MSDGYRVYQHWVHGRQTCLAHLIRRARGLSERHDPELAWFGRRVMTELQRLVHWATALPTSGAVQTWYARMLHLMQRYQQRRDEAGTFARALERELSALWTFVVEEGVEPTNRRAERARAPREVYQMALIMAMDRGRRRSAGSTPPGPWSSAEGALSRLKGHLSMAQRAG